MGSIPVAGAIVKEPTTLVGSFTMNPHGEVTSRALRSGIGFDELLRRLLRRPRKTEQIPVAKSTPPPRQALLLCNLIAEPALQAKRRKIYER